MVRWQQRLLGNCSHSAVLEALGLCRTVWLELARGLASPGRHSLFAATLLPLEAPGSQDNLLLGHEALLPQQAHIHVPLLQRQYGLLPRGQWSKGRLWLRAGMHRPHRDQPALHGRSLRLLQLRIAGGTQARQGRLPEGVPRLQSEGIRLLDGGTWLTEGSSLQSTRCNHWRVHPAKRRPCRVHVVHDALQHAAQCIWVRSHNSQTQWPLLLLLLLLLSVLQEQLLLLPLLHYRLLMHLLLLTMLHRL